MTGNRVLLVTGASGEIGAAIARLAGRRGYAVAVHYRRRAEAAARVVDDLVAAGGRAHAFQADTADLGAVIALYDAIESRLGAVGALVNNAGVIGGVRPITECDPALLAQAFGTNVFGYFYCTREFVRRLPESARAGAAIVNVSSAAARHGGMQHEAHYASSKGAVDSLTIALARELSPGGIRVNALRPGVIATAMHDLHGGAQAIRAALPSIPLGRPGAADEVAAAALWLLGPEASYMTGAIVDVSGGR